MNSIVFFLQFLFNLNYLGTYIFTILKHCISPHMYLLYQIKLDHLQHSKNRHTISFQYWCVEAFRHFGQEYIRFADSIEMRPTPSGCWSLYQPFIGIYISFFLSFKALPNWVTIVALASFHERFFSAKPLCDCFKFMLTTWQKLFYILYQPFLFIRNDCPSIMIHNI